MRWDIRTAPACPPSPVNLTRRAAGAAIAVELSRQGGADLQLSLPFPEPVAAERELWGPQERGPSEPRHLGPAAGWFSRDGFEGHVKANLECHLQEVSEAGSKVRVKYLDSSGATQEMFVDHVIAGTGYRVSLRKLRFLDSDMLQHVESVEDTPVLKKNFESSIPGLFMVGLASANSFGPLARFACGAGFTARQLSRALV